MNKNHTQTKDSSKKSKKSRKKLGVIITVVVVLTLVVGASFFFFNRWGRQASEDYLTTGNEKFTEQSYSAALSDYVNVIALSDFNQDNAYEAYLKIGSIYQKKGQIDQAITNYVAAAKIKSEEVEPLVRIIEVYFDNSDIEAAEAMTATALERDPEDPTVLTWQGRTLITHQVPTEAEAAFTKAWLANNNYAPATYYLALLNLGRDQSNSQEHLEKTIENAGNDLIKDKAGRLLEFLPKVTQAAHNPAYRDLFIGRELLNLNEPYFALAYFAEALEHDSDYRDAWLAKGRALIEVQQHKNAEIALSRAIEIDPTYGLSYYLMGLSRLRQDQLDEALDQIEQAQNTGYDNAEVQQTLAELHHKLQEFNKAEGNYRQALTFNSQDPDIFNSLLWLMVFDVKELNRAAAVAQSFEEKLPNSSRSRAWLAYLAFREGKDKAEVQKLIDQALAKNAFDALAHLTRGLMEEDPTALQSAIDFDEEGRIGEIAQEQLKQLIGEQ